MNTPSLSVGQKIELNDGRIAIVRFAGTTSFQTGEWVGIELEEATGKNDGFVKGERYFECQQGYGMFLRPSGVRQVLEDVKANKGKTVGNGVPGKGRAAGVNGLKRQSTVEGPGRRASVIAGSPTPGARSGLSGLRAPAKSPTKQLGSNGVSSTSTSRTSTPPAGKKPTASTATAKSRPSMQPPSTITPGRRTSAMPPPLTTTAQRTSRPSIAPPAAASQSTPGRSVPGRAPASKSPPPTTQASINERLSSTTEEDASEEGSEQPGLVLPKENEESSQTTESGGSEEHDDRDDTIKPNFAPPPAPPDPPQSSPTLSRPRRPSSPAAASVHSQKTIRSTGATNRQIEELEAKVRLLERKRLEDRDIKKNLDQSRQERDQYKGIIEKLQNKYRPQQQELADLKQALSESEKRFAEVETLQGEHDSTMEIMTLDREMAEETAEGLKAELEALRAHNEEVQLELDILREENGELTKEMSPEERESAGWVQLQHSNDRLRNALLALRDRSMDEKEELKEQIGSLEDEAKDLESLRTQHEETREGLLRSQADTDDLRQQLEVALQAEEMIEELTDRNGRLESNVDDLRATIEDLENLKELNDELEVNHVEAEKQLQEEIDFKDSLLLDRERTTRLQQEALDDKDGTITQFRTLVSTLQADMADMKASKQISESEAKDLEDRSRAMLDLNLKLQNSAAKTQVKTIDLELRKLDAQEASEHLAIVQLFLPEAFHAERDSVLALLRFKRTAFKANLVHGFVKERVASFGSRGMDEDVFAACDVLDKLTWIAAMVERFVNSICSCSAEEFANYESALYELEPVERALNSYIDGLRREEIKECDMAEELQRSIAVMSHLASLHIKDDLASHADDLLMRTQCLQSQLESTATALQLSRNMVQTYVPKALDEDDEDDEGSASDLATILNRAETLVNQARSAKVTAGKTHRALADLQARSLTLDDSCSSTFFSTTETVVAEVATYTRQAGSALQSLFGEEGRNDPFTTSEISTTLSRAATTTFSLQTPEAGPLVALATRMRTLTETLLTLSTLPTDLDNTLEFDRAPAPWVARAHGLKQTKITNIDTEAELARTLETLRARDAVVREKETELEEQSVRIEMLEARMKDAVKRSARIAELEKAVHDAREAEKRARRDVERAREEKDKEVERVREEVGRLAGEERRKNSRGVRELEGDDAGAGARAAVKRQERKISSLTGAVVYLKDENLRLRLPHPDSPLSVQATLDWLHEPLVKPKTARRKREENVAKEGKEVLQQLLSLASVPQTVDLTKMPENKLAWRPARETSRWRVERRKEEWEGWKEWRRDVLKFSGRSAAAKGVYAVTRAPVEGRGEEEV